MDYWFTADTHFGHGNMSKYRNFGTENSDEMNEILINNYNKVVKQGDMVYHLGDFSFDNKITEGIFDRLNGQKHLIIGNHDEDNKKTLKLNFNWIKVTYKLKINNQKYILSHFPFAIWNCKHHGAIHLHGHSHGKYKGEGRILDVGVDCHNFRPINIEEINAYMAHKTYRENEYE